MKKILLLVLLAIVSVSSYAQIGVTGGLDLMAGSGTVKDNMGFHVGGVYDIRLSKNIYFQPGLLFVYSQLKIDNQLLWLMKQDVLGNRYAFEIPAHFSYRPRMTQHSKFILDFGLYLQYVFHQSGNYSIETSLDDTSNPESYQGYLLGNSFCDLGPTLGVGVQVRQISIILSGQADFLRGIDDAFCRLGVAYVFKPKKHK